jgi:sugar/nucleoside kinase (ribokinase family)
VEKSGGSAANTIVGVAGFGARAAFVGKVKDDKLGQAFATTSAAPASPSTRRRQGRPVDRVLLRDGDAGRRAHHEHLPRRRAGIFIRTTSTPA